MANKLVNKFVLLDHLEVWRIDDYVSPGYFHATLMWSADSAVSQQKVLSVRALTNKFVYDTVWGAVPKQFHESAAAQFNVRNGERI
jgi:hypothetical protein